jgi:hypothetical protein
LKSPKTAKRIIAKSLAKKAVYLEKLDKIVGDPAATKPLREPHAQKQAMNSRKTQPSVAPSS